MRKPIISILFILSLITSIITNNGQCQLKDEQRLNNEEANNMEELLLLQDLQYKKTLGWKTDIRPMLESLIYVQYEKLMGDKLFLLGVKNLHNIRNLFRMIQLYLN